MRRRGVTPGSDPCRSLHGAAGDRRAADFQRLVQRLFELDPPTRYHACMTARVRKLIGGLGIILFLILYVGAAVRLAAMLPANAVVKLGYFAIVGIGWGVPIIPLITWMNRGR